MHTSKNIKRVNNNRNKKFNNLSNKREEEDEDDSLEKIDGRVIDALPNAHFRIDTSKGPMIAYLGGKLRVHKIKILVGDKVTLLLDEYGGKSRIIRRN